MPYTQEAHPIIWEISHRPMVMLLLSLARISQTYHGDVSNWAVEPGPWRRLGGLETVRTGSDRMTSFSKKMSRHGRGRGRAGTGRGAAQPGVDGGRLGSAIVGRRVPDRHRRA